MRKLKEKKPHLTIVWKTSGYSELDTENRDKQKLVNRINEHVMDILDQQQGIRYIHWGGAVEARSIGETRIKGDSINHYGIVPRLVALQMLTNTLVQQNVLDEQ